MFTGKVISARRVNDDGKQPDVIYRILWSDNDNEELSAPELGQAMAMYEVRTVQGGQHWQRKRARLSRRAPRVIMRL